MFSFIRRHQYLAMVFILMVIASFVVFFSPDMQMGGGASVDLGTIDGRKITRQEYLNAQEEAYLTHFFRYGDWPRAGSMSEQMGWKTEEQTRQRLALMYKVKDANLEVGDEAVAKQVAEFFRNAGGGQGSVQDKYNTFVETRLKPQGISDEDFRRFIAHELAIQQLGEAAGASGRLITPAVAEAAYRYENQQVETKAVVFLATNFVGKAKADIDPQALSQYYSNQVQNYNLPVRVQVSYVAFEGMNFLADAAQQMAKNTNMSAMVDQVYLQRGTNAFTDEKGAVLSAEKAKEKIREEARTEFAGELAQRKAYEFATDLHAMEPVSMTNLVALAGKKGLKVYETEPFGVFDGPKGIKDSRELSQQAFSLNREQPFSPEPVKAGDAYYVMAFKNRLPSVPQPFDAVKDKVREDYIEYRAAQLAREAGEKFAQAATNGVAAGKKFVDVAKEQNVKVLDLKPFTRGGRSIPELQEMRISPFQVSAAAFARKVGESSGFISSGDGGFVVYVEKFLPADEAKMESAVKESLEEMRSRRANIAFSEWINAQTQGVTPGGQ